MSSKKKWLRVAVLILSMCAAHAQAETIMLEDCGECAGHAFLGLNREPDYPHEYDGKEIVKVDNETISVVSGIHDITLDKVLIDVSDREGVAAFSVAPGAEVDLTVQNESILISGDECAGIQVPQGAKLRITEKSTGSVTAWGGMHGAGIGGGARQSGGEIRISGGTVIAKTRDENDMNYIEYCGIGGGIRGGFETIVITGGMVYAQGHLSGIGGTYQGACGSIEISGGAVYAIGGEDGASVGCTSEDCPAAITITGGTLYAINDDGGVSIGCNHGLIRFDGGKVYADGSILSDPEDGQLIVTDGLITVNGTILDRTAEN